MICLLLIAFGTLFVDYSVQVTEAHEAKILLRSVKDKTSSYAFELIPDVLKQISQLKRPIRVIAAVGNARVGKSTTLNLVTHIWKGKGETSAIEEVFKTGASLDPVTRDVWAHIIQHPDKDGNILLLDVEGTDLGDDSVTDRLSMFTAMMSSGLNIFALQVVKNGDIDFLYRIGRLSELVFKDKNIPQNFPKLRIVLRTNLATPSVGSIEEYVREKIFHSHGQKTGKWKKIENLFPRDTIAVSHIPSVNNSTELFKDVKKLQESSAWNSFENLVVKMKECPVKRTLEGSPVDGEALSTLAEKLVEVMNNNSWEDFGNVYVTIERDICRRSYEKYIKPVLMKRTSSEIEDKMIEALDEFKKECNLKNEIAEVKEEVKGALKKERKREEEERKRREEEKRRREEEKRRQDEESYWEYIKSAGKYALTLIAGTYLSDEDLKNNVITLPRSEFNVIGLRGVCWEWNENAEKTFGLTGEGCGVIAQDVKVLYPWAVTQGMDGYLRVHYGMLREMIDVVRSKNSSTFI